MESRVVGGASGVALEFQFAWPHSTNIGSMRQYVFWYFYILSYELGRNAVGVVSYSKHSQRSGVAATLGWRSQSRWDCRRSNRSRDFCHAFAPSENANGIPSQSPGLRGTRYPGSTFHQHF